MPRRKSTESTPADGPSMASIVKGALGLSAPLIAVLQSPALAAQDGTNRILIGGQGPMLDPPGLIAAGTAITTIAAYRLMKQRGRKPPDE